MLCFCNASYSEIRAYRTVFFVNPHTGEKRVSSSDVITYYYISNDRQYVYRVLPNGEKYWKDGTNLTTGKSDFRYQSTENGMVIYKTHCIFNASGAYVSKDEWDEYLYFSLDYTRINYPNPPGKSFHYGIEVLEEIKENYGSPSQIW